MYLLDTDILSNLLKKLPSSNLIRKLAETPPGDQFTTSITLGEMIYGANRLPHSEALIERILGKINPSQILGFDYEAALVYGRVRASLEKKGTVVAEADLRIGSIALSRDMTVVTANTRHFLLIPELKVENWLEIP